MNVSSPRRPADLGEHRVITHMAHGKTFRWLDGKGRNHSVHLDACFAVNSAQLQRQIALAGAGIALLPEFTIANDVKMGTLVRVLDDYRIENNDVTIKVAYQGREFLPGKVRAFVDQVVSHFDQLSISSPPQHAFHLKATHAHELKMLPA